MLPVNGLLETSLYVEEPQRSADFYQTLFGFSPVVVSERLIALAVERHAEKQQLRTSVT